jgi:enoyl-CoA hydratase/carnithine racemase
VSDHILIDIADGIQTICISRPRKKNALTIEMYSAMTKALRRADTDADVRVTLITGVDGMFTAGNDIFDFLERPPVDETSSVMQFLFTISTAETPIVAAVNGDAVGVGVTMLLHCDMVYAGETARLQLPFINLALVQEAGSSLLLPQMMGHQRAAELLMLGEPFSADVGHEAGFITAVCPDDEVLTTAQATARLLAAKPPAALRTVKALMKQANADVLRETILTEASHFGRMMQSPEAIEAFEAFTERRKPDFSKFA